jgi:hypothetical protein
MVMHALSDAATTPQLDHSAVAQLVRSFFSIISSTNEIVFFPVTNPESGAVAANAVPKTPTNNGGGGGLRGLLSAFGNKKRSVSQEKKRVVGSRIIERALAGKWI